MQLGGIGGVEWFFVIIVLVVLFFGVKRIPEIARSFGRASAEYEKARIQAKQELEQVKPQKNTNSGAAAEIERKKLESVADILDINYSDKSDDELRMAIDSAINTHKQSL